MVLRQPGAANDSGIVVFLQNGNYFLAEDGVAAGGGRTGIEHGTYSSNATAGAFASSRGPARYGDTNGTRGLSDATGLVTVRISADDRTLTATDGSGTLSIAHACTPCGFECTGLKANPKWTFEGEVFGFRLPDTSGNCPGGTVPLYRFYNNSSNEAPNHRFTTSPVVRAQMVAQGWTAEGLGPQVAFACAPQ